eukprot:GHVP01052271.1.p1 GENE.GHVP01052271.1~~GHVP01052271.1.p1  ORF type:complete len:288 (+),score=39.21 GHVP01052271.1:683-1546(+)
MRAVTISETQIGPGSLQEGLRYFCLEKSRIFVIYDRKTFTKDIFFALEHCNVEYDTATNPGKATLRNANILWELIQRKKYDAIIVIGPSNLISLVKITLSIQDQQQNVPTMTQFLSEACKSPPIDLMVIPTTLDPAGLANVAWVYDEKEICYCLQHKALTTRNVILDANLITKFDGLTSSFCFAVMACSKQRGHVALETSAYQVATFLLQGISHDFETFSSAEKIQKMLNAAWTAGTCLIHSDPSIFTSAKILSSVLPNHSTISIMVAILTEVRMQQTNHLLGYPYS